MKIKSEKDFWSGIMFLVVGIVFAVGATNYSMGTSARPGPGYFPLILSVILAILGAIVMFKSLTIETEGGDKIGSIAWRPLLVVVGSIAIFAILLPRLGMFITIPVLIVAVSFAGDEFKWKGVLIAAAVLTVFSWLVFVKGLGLTIPVLPNFIAN
ncbi:MAG TPA: tripartite tricarboxylate transporter TctB family protein [Rhizobacter sp.]